MPTSLGGLVQGYLDWKARPQLQEEGDQTRRKLEGEKLPAARPLPEHRVLNQNNSYNTHRPHHLRTWGRQDPALAVFRGVNHWWDNGSTHVVNIIHPPSMMMPTGLDSTVWTM